MVLKDDGCNTNVLSSEFVRLNRGLLDVRPANVTIAHSDRDATEKAHEMVFGTTIQIGNHRYTSNWAVANSRYDVILGMPWHQQHNPAINYEQRTVRVAENSLPVQANSQRRVKVEPIGVKKFRSLLKKRGTKRGSKCFA